MESLGHCLPRESSCIHQQGLNVLGPSQYLLGSTALLSDLVDKRDRLSNEWFDVLREFTLVTENLAGIHTSNNERKSFFLVPGLDNGQLKSDVTIGGVNAFLIP